MGIDHLGSVAAVVSEAGTLISEQRYREAPPEGHEGGMPFGEVRTDIGTISQTDFSFTGQRSISMLSIMDYIARNYDPAIGRFLQPDSIVPNPANPQSWNRYSYVINNPIMYSDPTGHSWEDCNKRMNGYQCKIHQRQVHRLMAEWKRNASLLTLNSIDSDESCSDLVHCSVVSLIDVMVGINYSKEEAQYLRDLLGSGNADAKWAVKYILENNIHFQVVEGGSLGGGVGAAWFNIKHPLVSNVIWIDRGQLEGNYEFTLSLIVHETIHASQGRWPAIHVKGELEAWQRGFWVYYDITDKKPGYTKAEMDAAWSIMNLPLSSASSDPNYVRQLMVDFSTEYNAWVLLPWSIIK